MTNSIFITSTGTEIGKTLVTASLCYQLRSAGKTVQAIKPLISGVTPTTMEGSDTAIIAEALGQSLTEKTIDAISPFRYIAPLAPAMAAELEGKSLDYGALLSTCQNTLEKEGISIVEGVGGTFVPLVGQKLVADWIKDLQIPTLMVTGSYLGTISHTLATLEASEHRGIETKAIIISETAPLADGTPHPDLQKTAEQIATLTGKPVITLGRLSGVAPWENTPSITHLI